MADAAREFRFNAERLTRERVNKLMRAVGIEALKRMIERTPVKTGRAQGNWNASVDRADDSVNDDASVADVANSLTAGTGTVAKIDFFTGEVLYLCNGVSYVMRLEDGSSSQAPSGMAAVTIEEMRLYAEEVASQLGRENA